MIKVEKLEYDFDSATSEQLCSAIKVKRGGGAFFTSIALAAHGDDAAPGFNWKISEKISVTGGELSAGALAVMKALGRATGPHGRVDLLACSLLYAFTTTPDAVAFSPVLPTAPPTRVA